MLLLQIHKRLDFDKRSGILFHCKCYEMSLGWILTGECSHAKS